MISREEILSSCTYIRSRKCTMPFLKSLSCKYLITKFRNLYCNYSLYISSLSSLSPLETLWSNRNNALSTRRGETSIVYTDKNSLFKGKYQLFSTIPNSISVYTFLVESVLLITRLSTVNCLIIYSRQ